MGLSDYGIYLLVLHPILLLSELEIRVALINRTVLFDLAILGQLAPVDELLEVRVLRVHLQLVLLVLRLLQRLLLLELEVDVHEVLDFLLQLVILLEDHLNYILH
jgi:hypothetical protein